MGEFLPGRLPGMYHVTFANMVWRLVSSKLDWSLHTVYAIFN